MQRIAPTYLVAQGLAVAGWWLLLFAQPASRHWFLPGGELSLTLRAFLLPDLLVLGLASLGAGAGRIARARWAASASWLVAGGAVYAALFTVGWALLEPVPPLSTALMLVAAAGSVGSASADL